MHAADAFTLVRIIASPLFILIYFLPSIFGDKEPSSITNIISVCIIVPLILFAEFTDYLDGHYARKHNVVSDFGKLFDPFADVILHLTTFFCYTMTGYISPFIVLLFVYREFGQLFLRMIAAKKGVAIAARKGGKFKTVLYIVAGFYSLFLECCLRLGFTLPSYNIWFYVGYGLYIAGLIASYASFIDYLVHFIPVITKDDK
ncbi:MAG: CDP-diacylglycerol--glycerol-3-phosphate 3-phosphatidyltransferase [Treponemataceae bacterium]|nr:CDP-diacylglycerol--glycerol-3-phosphate 3-phosphatidyltransferase [Treponemataceae bacterium]